MSPGDHVAEALVADAHGQVFCRSKRDSLLLRTVELDRANPWPLKVRSNGGLAFGPDGALYVANLEEETIVAYDATGKKKPIADGLRSQHLLVTHEGDVYASVDGSPWQPSRIWRITFDGKKSVLDEGRWQPSGIALSPDGLWLAVAEASTHWGYSFRVEPGGLADKQQYYWFHVPDWADDSGAGSWCADREGRLYAATHMGVQVFDRNGRVRAILPLAAGRVTAVCFGGPKFDHLYVIAGSNVYKRQLKAIGLPPAAAPIKLPPWGAG